MTEHEHETMHCLLCQKRIDTKEIFEFISNGLRARKFYCTNCGTRLKISVIGEKRSFNRVRTAMRSFFDSVRYAMRIFFNILFMVIRVVLVVGGLPVLLLIDFFGWVYEYPHSFTVGVFKGMALWTADSREIFECDERTHIGASGSEIWNHHRGSHESNVVMLAVLSIVFTIFWTLLVLMELLGL